MQNADLVSILLFFQTEYRLTDFNFKKQNISSVRILELTSVGEPTTLLRRGYYSN